MSNLWKVITAILAIETLILCALVSRTPEVKLKATDHVSCDESGYSKDSGLVGPIDVQFQLGTYDNRILVIKTQVDSWERADAICESWNNIGYELEK